MARKKASQRKVVKKRSLILILVLVVVVASFLFYLKANKSSLEIFSPENRTYSDGNIPIRIFSKSEIRSMERQIDDQPRTPECGSCFYFVRNDTLFTKGTHTYSIYANISDGTEIVRSVVFTVA